MSARDDLAAAIWLEIREGEDRCDMEWDDMPENHTHFVAADAILAALPSMGYVHRDQIRVKPLGWVNSWDHGEVYKAGNYSILHGRKEASLFYKVGDNLTKVTCAPTLEAAKAAADAHHAAQVLAALDIQESNGTDLHTTADLEAAVLAEREALSAEVEALRAQVATADEMAAAIDDFGNLKPSDSSEQWGMRLQRCLDRMQDYRAILALITDTPIPE